MEDQNDFSLVRRGRSANAAPLYIVAMSARSRLRRGIQTQGIGFDADQREARHLLAIDLDALAKHAQGAGPETIFAIQRLIDDQLFLGLRMPGQTQHRTGMPSRVTASPITICGRSGRLSLEWP